MPLHRLTKIVVGVPDVAAAVPFYADFGLAHLGDGRFATTDGGEQLELASRARRGLIELGIGCDDAGDLDRISHDLASTGIAHQRHPDAVTVTDQGSGVRARISIASRYQQPPAQAPASNGPGVSQRVNERVPGTLRTAAVRPRRLGHVVVGSTDVEASERLFIGILGFQVSDAVRNVGKFVRCSTDHHNLMVSAAPAQFMHHTSWQVDDVDEVGRGAAGMLAADPARHAWGLGRHNVGGNFFWYLRDPAGNYAEYYSDLDIITEQLRWDVREWGARESVCAWGPKPPKGFFRPDDLAELMMKGDGG
jgi:catechol 2,3-dioxygenase-like lactoylglutathione lyase family enzyme